jgi:hypothetical protein
LHTGKPPILIRIRKLSHEDKFSGDGDLGGRAQKCDPALRNAGNNQIEDGTVKIRPPLTGIQGAIGLREPDVTFFAEESLAPSAGDGPMRKKTLSYGALGTSAFWALHRSPPLEGSTMDRS